MITPPDATVYHLIVLPGEVAFRLDDAPVQIALRVAVTEVGRAGSGLKVISTSSYESEHGGLDIIQRKVYADPATPVNVEVGLEGVLIVPPDPDRMVH
jgi:hypothetical protein